MRHLVYKRAIRGREIDGLVSRRDSLDNKGAAVAFTTAAPNQAS
jgi:hypothetical protein